MPALKKKRKKRRFSRRPKSTMHLAKLYPRAFKALPSAYRADEALNFKIKNGKLVASHKDFGGESTYQNGKWK